MILRNPFAVKSPEELNREEIVKLFVAQYTRIEAIKERRHTFVWGSRGSGKSMMLRYLEPQCKEIVHGSLDIFFSQSGAFLGVYCPCKEGHLNKTELDLLPEYPRLVVTEHLLNLTVAERTLSCLSSQIPSDSIVAQGKEKFLCGVLELFDKAAIASSVAAADRKTDRVAAPIAWLNGLFSEEVHKVGRFLRGLALSKEPPEYSASTTGYHDFLLPFMQLVRILLAKWGVPIYILLDDADRLTAIQQQIVNTWIANRDQKDLCVKVSARREGYKTFKTRDGVEIEEPHDYSTVDVDELYTRSKSDYSEKVVLIADRRLELSPVPTKSIKQFLPSDRTQAEMLKQIVKKTAEEWPEKGKPGRQADYVNRYSMARLFQELNRRKRRRNYAGFENIVHLSSGIVRDFLEPCYLMFDRLIEQGQDATLIAEIPASLQDKVLFDYSEEFVIHKFDNIRRGLPTEKWGQIDALATLVGSLGKLFYKRLHDPDARESRLFSFTVRGHVPPEIERVLELGIEYRYFQLRSYSTKEGGGREKWYVLNRRVCPAFKLDPTGFEGRISIKADLLKLACENTEQFVALRLREEKTESSEALPLFSLE